MRKLFLMFAAVLAFAFTYVQGQDNTYEKLKEKASYAHGYQVAFSMADYIKAEESDDEALLQGIKDGIADKSRFNDDEAKQISEEYQGTIVKNRQEKADQPMPEALLKNGSYVTGVALAQEYVLQENFPEEIDTDQIVKGVKEGLKKGREIARAMEKRQSMIQAFDLMKQSRRMRESLENKKKGQAFLEENAKKDGIVTLESGLQYKVLKKAENKDAKSPTENDAIKVHYVGKLLDGTEFDNSMKRGEPAVFTVKGSLGWVEAVSKMKVGEKWKFFVPPELGYGDKPQPPHIGANSTLIFEVELLEVMPPATEAAVDPASKMKQ